MGPDPVCNTGVCSLVWSGGGIHKESTANFLGQCIFHITGVSLPSHIYKEDPGKLREWSSSRNNCR